MTFSNKSAATSGHNGDRYAGVVFWGLLLLAAPVFAMCVLAPEWQTYEAMLIAERTERNELNLLKQRLAQQKRDLQALRQDPAVVARLARRDLGYRRVGERDIHVTLTALDVSPVSLKSTPASSDFSRRWGVDPAGGPEPQADLAPVISWPQRWANLLPDYSYDRVFSAEPTRTIVFVMSTALIAIAYGLFWRRSTSASHAS